VRFSRQNGAGFFKVDVFRGPSWPGIMTKRNLAGQPATRRMGEGLIGPKGGLAAPGRAAQCVVAKAIDTTGTRRERVDRRILRRTGTASGGRAVTGSGGSKVSYTAVSWGLRRRRLDQEWLGIGCRCNRLGRGNYCVKKSGKRFVFGTAQCANKVDPGHR